MSGEFVDTNILVYAHDPTSSEKHEKARELVKRLWISGEGVLSIQVLQEFFWTITRKVPQPVKPTIAVEIIRDIAAWPVYSPSAADVIRAAELSSSRRSVSFWDAMILQACYATGATILWSEDLSDGTDYDGVVVRNPFA